MRVVNIIIIITILLVLLQVTIVSSLSLNSNNHNSNNMLRSSDSSFRFKNTVNNIIDNTNSFSISNNDLLTYLKHSPIPKLIDKLLKEESLYIVLENLRATDNIIDGLWLTGYYLSSSSFQNSTSHLLELNTIPSIDAIVRLPTVSEYENTQEFIEYNHIIYPRRLCHRLLTVRDKICEELIEDLRYIINENDDIKKSGLSRLFLSEKRAPSLSSIDEDYSTVFRKNNFKKLNKVITNEVINLVRNKLSSSSSQLAYLDSHIDKNYDYNIYIQDDEVSVNEISCNDMKLLSTAILGCGGSEELNRIESLTDKRTPRSFLHSLYAEGELKGLERQADGTYFNKLKMAKDIIDLRESISEYIGHVLDAEQRAILKSFRSIKDAGLKLDDREELTPVHKAKDFTKDQANAWLEEGLAFGHLRAAAAADAAAKNAATNKELGNENGMQFFPCAEDSNRNINDGCSSDEQFGSHSYGDVMLM